MLYSTMESSVSIPNSHTRYSTKEFNAIQLKNLHLTCPECKRTVSGVMALRSWCLPPMISGSEYGRLKSPMRFGWSSEVARAEWMTASEWQRISRRPEDMRGAANRTFALASGVGKAGEDEGKLTELSTDSLARLVAHTIFDDVGVSTPKFARHGEVSTWDMVRFSVPMTSFSFDPRRRLRPNIRRTDGSLLDWVESSVTSSRSGSVSSSKPSSESMTGGKRVEEQPMIEVRRAKGRLGMQKGFAVFSCIHPKNYYFVSSCEMKTLQGNAEKNTNLKSTRKKSTRL